MGTGHIVHASRIGLTGGIGSGKTTASDIFKNLGVAVIDADEISHDLMLPGQPAYAAIINEFGPDVVDKDGKLRRDYLRQLVFSNTDLLKQLESIIHPLVRLEIQKQVNLVEQPYCIISIPLLFESGLQDSVDRILVVDIPETLQIERASLRDKVAKSDIKKIIQLQTSRDIRLQNADDIIRNDRDMEHLRSQVLNLHKKYLILSETQLTKCL